jgi:hypothetical protein
LALNQNELPASVEMHNRILQSRRREVELAQNSINIHQRAENLSNITMDEYLVGKRNSKRLVPAYEKVLSLPWFNRTWVIQETALSPTMPLPLFGDFALSWTKILGILTFARQPIGFSVVLEQEGRRLTRHETVMPLRDWQLQSVGLRDVELRDGVRMAMMKYPQAAMNLRVFALMRNLEVDESSVTSRTTGSAHAGGVSLESLLLMTPCFEATYIHDRVNGLLGLAKEARVLGNTGSIPPVLKPTYDKRFEDWTRELTRYIIETSRSLQIWWVLRDTRRLPDLPSWAVDFGDTSQNLLFFGNFTNRDSYSDKGDFLPNATIFGRDDFSGANQFRTRLSPNPSDRPIVIEPHDNPNILGLKGVRVDVVQHVCPVLANPQSLIQTWKAYRSEFRHDEAHNTFGSSVLQFLWAWSMQSPGDLDISPSSIGHLSPSEAKSAFEVRYYRIPTDGDAVKGVCLNLLDAFQSTGETDGPWVRELMDHSGMHHSANRMVRDFVTDIATDKILTEHYIRIKQHIPAARGHSIFWTSQNRNIGRCGSSARPGDLICRLNGGESPMILRPMESPHHYRLIGPCYIANYAWYMRRAWEKDEYTDSPVTGEVTLQPSYVEHQNEQLFHLV